MSARLRVLAAAHLYRLAGSDDPRALPVIVSAPPPARHHNLFALAGRPDESGFLLSDGTFADRKRAGEIAIAAGQTPGLNWGPDLYSEDLW
jgi:hypothetical protein